MKTILLFASLILLLAIQSQGAVIVYRHSHSAQYIGQGFYTRVFGTGFTVLDSQSLTGFNIIGFRIRGQKYFATSPFEKGLRNYSVTGSFGRPYTTFVGSGLTNKPTRFEDRIEFTIGANSSLAITPTNLVSLPRVLNILSHAIVVPTNQPAVAVQGHGIASYSRIETRLANSLAETPGDSLSRYRMLLISRGYQETPAE
jgi:hypothetical protein